MNKAQKLLKEHKTQGRISRIFSYRLTVTTAWLEANPKKPTKQETSPLSTLLSSSRNLKTLSNCKPLTILLAYQITLNRVNLAKLYGLINHERHNSTGATQKKDPLGGSKVQSLIKPVLLNGSDKMSIDLAKMNSVRYL
jgi:hypothetical protein